MFRPVLLLRSVSLSKATRLQLGNLKTEYGTVSTAAGSHEKWGFLYRARKYPALGHFYMATFIITTVMVSGTYQQYRDMMIVSENICYEDVKDRCLTPMPGWARLRSIQIANPAGPQTFRDPTPLDWLPFELKLGYVKQASY
ncbi:transmembrane protein, putative [Bodo saltans]|uniref:Transmembrane protein, putative n=1 Tax=Bodo saltans TaxID=75058 RepID=A0A0S4KFM7_BODSA|nr:transmembrane protein, putative [Bodo saltans]|eukprot:CUI14398.1 transmembrane protein, putative [Bodo saltans]